MITDSYLPTLPERRASPSPFLLQPATPDPPQTQTLFYVLQAGRVIQQGSFDDLMAQEGVFRTMSLRQMA